jgi:hypothetical protein
VLACIDGLRAAGKPQDAIRRLIWNVYDYYRICILVRFAFKFSGRNGLKTSSAGGCYGCNANLVALCYRPSHFVRIQGILSTSMFIANIPF